MERPAALPPNNVLNGASSFVCAALLLSLPLRAEAPPPLPAIDMAEFARVPVTLANGSRGEVVTFQSHSPKDFAPMLSGDLGPEVQLSAQLFRPAAVKGRIPVVILVPGSANIGPHHLMQAAALARKGMAVLIIDPFTGRNLTDSIADQGRFSWAASVYDVVAAMRYLRSRRDIDRNNIGALGGSRGGTAVMMAASRPISEKLLGRGKGLRAVVAGYPWCGTQFKSAKLAKESRLLVMSGDRDDWVSVQQCQGAVSAMAAAGSRAEMRLVADALHAFDRGGVSPRRIEHAVTSTIFPAVYMDDEGRFFDLYSAKLNPKLTSGDFVRRSVDGGFVHKGVTIGSTGNQAKQYEETAVAFLSQLKRE